MTREMEQGLDVALAKLLARQYEILEVSAAQAYITGEIAAHKTLRMGISIDLVHKEALKYGREYGTLLREKGASIINGKEVHGSLKTTKQNERRLRRSLLTVSPKVSLLAFLRQDGEDILKGLSPPTCTSFSMLGKVMPRWLLGLRLLGSKT